MTLTRAELDALPPPSRRPRWRRILNFWPVLLVVAVLAAAIAGFSSLFAPHYRNMLFIGEGSCMVDPSSGSAWVAIPMHADSYGVQWRVERVVGDGPTVLGLAALSHGQTLVSLDPDQLAGLREALRDPHDNAWVHLNDESRVVVIAFDNTGTDDEATVEEIVLWWAHGEPAGLQRVALNMVWNGDECSVSTHELPEVAPSLEP